MKSDELGNQDRHESVCPDVKSKCDTHLKSNVRVRPARGSPYPQYEDYVGLLSLMRYATKTDMSRFVQMLSQNVIRICSHDHKSPNPQYEDYVWLLKVE